MKDNKEINRPKFPKKRIENFQKCQGLRTFIIIVALWIALTSIVQRVMCPSFTETEIFIRIPKSFIGDFKCCVDEE